MSFIESLIAAKAGGGSGGSSGPADWNTMLNKPFYSAVEKTTGPLDITWDGVIGDKYHVEAGGDILCKVSDVVFSAAQLVGATIVGRDGEDITETVLTEDEVSDGSVFGFPGVAEALFSVICVYEPCAPLGTFTLELPGTYFMLKNTGEYTASLSNPNAMVECLGEVVHTLDPKYIPDTVATKADLEAAIGTAIGGSY